MSLNHVIANLETCKLEIREVFQLKPSLILSATSFILASLLSSSRLCLRTALIDLDNVQITSKTPSVTRQLLLWGSKISPKRTSDQRIRQYIFSQQCPRRFYHHSPLLRHPYLAVQRNPYASYSVGNLGIAPAPNDILVAAEGEWLQPDGPSNSEPWVSSDWNGFDEPLRPPRFDWRKRALSRTGFINSTPDKRKKYPKRKIPSLEPTQPGELYFEAIESYQNQCVCYHFVTELAFDCMR